MKMKKLWLGALLMASSLSAYSYTALETHLSDTNNGACENHIPSIINDVVGTNAYAVNTTFNNTGAGVVSFLEIRYPDIPVLMVSLTIVPTTEQYGNRCMVNISRTMVVHMSCNAVLKEQELETIVGTKQFGRSYHFVNPEKVNMYLTKVGNTACMISSTSTGWFN